MAKVPEIKQQLEELGVKFDSKLKKPELEALLQAQEHVVTEEDLVNNPELTNEGVVVGDLIYLPVQGKDDEDLGAGDDDSTEEKPVVKKDPVIGTFSVSNKLKEVYYVAEIKDANGKPCVQVQCLDGSAYRLSVEEAGERLKLKK